MSVCQQPFYAFDFYGRVFFYRCPNISAGFTVAKEKNKAGDDLTKTSHWTHSRANSGNW